jgi:hypothetical protein
MTTTKWTAWTRSVALAATLGACAGYPETDGGYVEAETTYPARVHYYDPFAPDYVYFYDGPEVVVRREVFVERDGRRYYRENDHDGDRRIYFDHQRALESRAPPHGERR